MHHTIQKYNNAIMATLPAFGVNFKPADIIEIRMRQSADVGDRVMTITGLCIAKHNTSITTSCVVRIMTGHGAGVERRIPIYSPLVQSIKVIRPGVSRRAKLYYIRKLTGKKARIRQDRSVSGMSRLS